MEIIKECQKLTKQKGILQKLKKKIKKKEKEKRKKRVITKS